MTIHRISKESLKPPSLSLNNIRALKGGSSFRAWALLVWAFNFCGGKFYAASVLQPHRSGLSKKDSFRENSPPANSSAPPSSTGMRGQSLEKGDISTLFIHGTDVDIILEGKKTYDSKINLTTNATAQLGKKKTSLKLSAPDGQCLKGRLIIPHGMRVVISGGSVTLNMDGFIGDLVVNAGSAQISGQGKFSRFALVSGTAKVALRGLMGQTYIQCGDGDIQARFIPELHEEIPDLVIPLEGHSSKENKYISSGLRLNRPSVKINMHLAKGQARLFFPKDSGVCYPKDHPHLKTFSVRHQLKRAPYRIFPYLSDAALLSLSTVEE